MINQVFFANSVGYLEGDGDEFLAVAAPLARQVACGEVQEGDSASVGGGGALRGQGARQPRLARPRRPRQQDGRGLLLGSEGSDSFIVVSRNFIIIDFFLSIASVG